MRVVTQFGFGEILSGFDPLEVALDQPFLDKSVITLARREVFPFTKRAVIRTLNITGVGIVSNLQFVDENLSPESYFAGLRVPPDETHFIFDLVIGAAQSSQQMGIFTDNYLLTCPSIDRWELERHAMFEERKEALDAFDHHVKQLAGFMGIGTLALFDTLEGRLLRLVVGVPPPQGIIYNWRPEVPTLPGTHKRIGT